MDDRSMIDLTDLEGLGRRVATESDAGASDAAGVIHRARRRALASWEASRGGGRRRRVAVFARLAVAAAFVLVVAGLFARRPAPPPLSFVVGAEAAPRPVGAWIAAAADAVPIHFSEGTEVALASGGRARVTRADADGARMVLERGSLRAKVVHRSAATRWSFEAGPFEVEVVGTELETTWDPVRDVVEVGVVEGRVLVRGPGLDGSHPVSAGQRLRVSLREQRVELGPIAAVDVAPSAPAPVAAPAEATTTAPGAPPPRLASPASPASPAAADDWRALEAKGKHRDAMAAVLHEGFAAVLARSSASDLLALADAARYSGDAVHARDALLAARARGARGSSAFLLGKIAADQLGASREAIGWFQTAFAEGGGFAEPALGRLIELQRAVGDGAAAQSSAEQYLRRFPNGAYRSLASAVAGP
jgi:hypothetical protein